MAYRTFKEWQSRGRSVEKGQKAMGFLLDGASLFGKEQTVKSLPCKSPQQIPDSWYLGDGEDYQ